MLQLVFALLVSISLQVNSVSKGNMKQYYTCYFNKYFKLPLNDTIYKSDRELFVASKIKTHELSGEREPSIACVGWICDPALIWDWKRSEDLETWSYFALPGNWVKNWGQCFQDEQENFRTKNYSFTSAGVFSRLQLSDGRTRVFFVPNEECHNKGEVLSRNATHFLSVSLQCLQP